MKVAITYNLKTKDTEEQAEFDEWPVVRDIARLIRSMGHIVDTVDVGTKHFHTQSWISDLISHSPDVVFNMAEGIGSPSRESIIPAILEELRIPFTGSDAATMALTLNKFQAKKLAEGLGIKTPEAMFAKNGERLGTYPGLPEIIKPNFEGSSKGINKSSVINSIHEPGSLILSLLEKYPDGVLVESFLTGYDGSVVCLNMGGWRFFPVWYETLKHNNKHNIRTYDLKNKHAEHVKVRRFREINGVARLMIDYSGLLIRAFNIKDIARVDFRIHEDKPYFLEVNPLPTLGKGTSVFLASKNAGYTAKKVIAQMLSNAVQRAHGLQ